MSDPERNKAAARTVFEVWSTGELHRLDAIVAPHVIHHDPYDPNAAAGLAGMKRTIEEARRRSPGLKLEVLDQLAEGDRLATRWVASMPNGDKRVTLSGITIDRFEGGKIVEAWRCMDRLGFLQQTGGIEVKR
jgi:predicted ester cyclase